MFCDAGKSSAINALTRRKNLAHTSKTPGRTQTINVFTLTKTQRLIDLPGYGFAKAAKTVQQNWQALLTRYLHERKSLKGLILLMDIRHPLKDLDWMLIEWAVKYEVPLHILLTKADKLNRGAASNALQQIQKELDVYDDRVTCQLFSAKTRDGVETTYEVLDAWLA